MAVVIDDRLLLDVLAGQSPGEIAAELGGGGIFTASAWYYRLGRAVFGGSGSGALSGGFASLDHDVARQVRAQLGEPPSNVACCTPGRRPGDVHPPGATPVEGPRRRGPSGSPAASSSPSRHDRRSPAAFGHPRDRHRLPGPALTHYGTPVTMRLHDLFSTLMVKVDITADLNDEDDTGYVWTFLDEARDRR